MTRGGSKVVVVVRKDTSPRRRSEILRWIRTLVPAALIVVSSVPVEPDPTEDTITVGSDDVDAGPLAVADALARARIARE